MEAFIAVATAVGTALGGIATLVSLFIANKAAMIAKDAIKTSEAVAKIQVALSQRQLLLPLWQYLSTLSQIDPGDPVWPDVLKAMNTLELVALCEESGAVDAQVIRRTFREQYIRLYESIAAIKEEKPKDGKLGHPSGQQLLRENRAARNFYDELDKEHMAQDKPSQLLAESNEVRR